MAEGSQPEFDLDELDRLHAAATPGRWKLWAAEVRADLDGSSELSKSELVAHTHSRPDPKTGAMRATNAYLIAALQRAWPAVSKEVARLREQAGLEQAVREALGSRWHMLQLTRLALSDKWVAHWDNPAPAPKATRKATGDTLTALLRAILEVEAKS